MYVEVKVGALIMDPNSNSPIVVLKGVQEDLILPIWVGAYEANSIALEIEKIVPPRPMTHDLIKNFINELQCSVNKIFVTDLIDNTFYALIEIIDLNGNIISLDARPSDAIALALRTDSPIFIAKKVFELSNAISTQIEKISQNEESVKSIEEWPDLIG